MTNFTTILPKPVKLYNQLYVSLNTSVEFCVVRESMWNWQLDLEETVGDELEFTKDVAEVRKNGSRKSTWGVKFNAERNVKF